MRVELLTRDEWDGLDDDHPHREAFDSYEQFQRYQQVEALQTLETVASEARGVAVWAGGLLALYLAARGADDLLSPY